MLSLAFLNLILLHFVFMNAICGPNNYCAVNYISYTGDFFYLCAILFYVANYHMYIVICMKYCTN